MMQDYSLLLIRLVIGLVVAAHGAQKLFGWFSGSGIEGTIRMISSLRIRPPKFWAIVAGLDEFVGGLLTAVGFLMPLGPMMIVANMLAAISYVHWTNGFWNSKRGYEFPLVLSVVSFALAIADPGRYAVDTALKITLPEPATFVALVVIVLLGFFSSFVSVHSLGRMGRQATTG